MSYYTEVKGTIEFSIVPAEEDLYSCFNYCGDFITPQKYDVEGDINYFGCPSVRLCVSELQNVISGRLECTTEENDHYLLEYDKTVNKWKRYGGQIVYNYETGEEV